MRPDDQLELHLRQAGADARAALRADARPSPAFADDLRDRLLGAYADGAAAGAARRSLVAGWGWRVAAAVPAGIAAAVMLAFFLNLRTLHPTADKPTPGPSQPAPVVIASGSPEPSGPDFLPAPASAEPSPSVSSTAEPTATPTARPTPKPTPKPTPRPTPIPVGTLSLGTTSCPGGVVLSWSAFEDARFAKYVTLWSTSSSIPATWPASGGAAILDGSGTTQVGALSAADTAVDPGVTRYYRTLALDSGGGVIAFSPVRAGTGVAVASLGTAVVTADATSVGVSWTPAALPDGCFTWYKVVVSEESTAPSYLAGDPYVAVLENPAASSVSVPVLASGTAGPDGLVSGHTYYLRVQVIRSTALGLFEVAHSTVATFTVP